eukprot:243717-Prorocentrum_minimum.AAC.1
MTEEGESALYAACACRRVEVLEALVRHPHVNLKLAERWGLNPLFHEPNAKNMQLVAAVREGRVGRGGSALQGKRPSRVEPPRNVITRR